MFFDHNGFSTEKYCLGIEVVAVAFARCLARRPAIFPGTTRAAAERWGFTPAKDGTLVRLAALTRKVAFAGGVYRETGFSKEDGTVDKY